MAKKSFEERYAEELAKQKKKMQEMEEIQKKLEELGKKAEEERRQKFKKSGTLFDNVISICAKKRIDPQVVEDAMNELLKKVEDMPDHSEEPKEEIPEEAPPIHGMENRENENREPSAPVSSFMDDLPIPGTEDSNQGRMY